MDAGVQKALHDKLYDRRKGGALEIERIIRDDLATNNHERIAKIVTQLCNDFAYDVHHPYARTGGLIGLAAASIALGSDVPRYLKQIVPPVLACFADQDARVRYYACESMYNIAKTSKGEVLPYFNDIFDALAKLAADTEMSVKNGAELLDRLIKDIVSESATSYVSVVQYPEILDEDEAKRGDHPGLSTAFSLPRFIPLLQERIYVLNPYTRTFLVSWITLLDSIPDLELVSYLPSFLGGLFGFLNDTTQDVVTATQHALERFLDEIKLVARVKRGLAESRKEKNEEGAAASTVDTKSVKSVDVVVDEPSPEKEKRPDETDDEPREISTADGAESITDDDSIVQEDWIPGQDVHVDHPKILDILITFLGDASEEHVQLTALRWIDSFFDICPEDILPFVPRLLNHVLPALSSDIEQVRQAGNRVNTSLTEYIMSLSDEEEQRMLLAAKRTRSQSPPPLTLAARRANGLERRETAPAGRIPRSAGRAATFTRSRGMSQLAEDQQSLDEYLGKSLDYEASVNALTLQFLNESEATRVAALSWLLMLQRRAPQKVLAAHDGTFPALLKTLSDPSDTVVTRDLQLLSQISKNSDDSYFTFFMVNLLKLFCTDRRLLENRGNLIIRQLCVNLSPERIYRTMADCLEKDEDVEFASIMVQNLNNNLITAPELADLRKKLRNWETRDGQVLFVPLFRAWCHNAVATISLCLLAQAYEQAYNLLQIFADIEMTVNMLIQIDKLVQLLESPVFTYLRLQLLEPTHHPYLYKTLYGILMLLPQSAAFAALKNRLNSVSAIGYLHVPSPFLSSNPSTNPTTTSSSASANNPSSSSTTTTTGLRGQLAPGTQGVVSVAVPAFERANRLKPRDSASANLSQNVNPNTSTPSLSADTSSTTTTAAPGGSTQPASGIGGGQGGPNTVKWAELLDKFRATQDRARPSTKFGANMEHGYDSSASEAAGGKPGHRHLLMNAGHGHGQGVYSRPGSAGGDGGGGGAGAAGSGSGVVGGNHGGGGGGGGVLGRYGSNFGSASGGSNFASSSNFTSGSGAGGGKGVDGGHGASGSGGAGGAGAGGAGASGHRSKFSASHLGRFARGVGGMAGGGGGGGGGKK